MNWLGQASEHDADHGETDEGRGGSRVTLEVACEPSMAADPCQSSLDDPTFGQDDEAMQRRTRLQRDLPAARLGGDGGVAVFQAREQRAPSSPNFSARAILAKLERGSRALGT
jgi:hypothetical protein